jgi:hypothetical protein
MIFSSVVQLNHYLQGYRVPIKLFHQSSLSEEKAQLCSPKVKYLGVVLEKQTNSEQLHPILDYHLPKTLQQLKAFLGVTRSCQI